MSVRSSFVRSSTADHRRSAAGRRRGRCSPSSCSRPRTRCSSVSSGRTVRELEALGPDFVSVTYGASGSTRDRTIVATEAIAQNTTLRSMAHLTCASQSRDQLRRVIGSYAASGIRHVLAIRGDMPGGPTVPWVRHPEGLANATELVALVRELGDFCVGVAAFPDLHPERPRPRSGRPDPGREGRGRRELRDHPAVLHRRTATSSWSTGSARSAATCRSSRASCRSPGCRQIQRFAELSGADLPAQSWTG